MTYRPYSPISPDDFAALPDEDKQLLEALVAAFLAEIELQRATGARAPAPG